MTDTKRRLPKDMSIKFIPVMEKIIIEYYNLNLIIFRSNTEYRRRDYVWARQLLMHFQYNYMKLSLAAVGGRYGKDHATVMHARKAVENACETDKQIANDYEKIYYMIHAAYTTFAETGDRVCYKCGSFDGISMLLWVNPNKDMIIEATPENGPGMCEKCGETVIVTKHEYQTQYA